MISRFLIFYNCNIYEERNAVKYVSCFALRTGVLISEFIISLG